MHRPPGVHFRDQSIANHAFLKELICDIERIDNHLLEVVVMLLDDAFLCCRLHTILPSYLGEALVNQWADSSLRIIFT